MRSGDTINITIWNAARGGMRSVVEAYEQDGFVESEHIRLIAAYTDGSFAYRQWILAKALAEFLGTVATRKVAIVHCHSSMRGSFWRKGLFASIARIFGIPVVLHLHGSEMKPFYHAQRPFLQKRIRGHLEKATRVLVLSDSWKSFISGIAPEAKVEVVPNYVRMPAPRDSSASGKQILFLGLIGDRKGVFDLIPAFADVHKRHPDARLIIGGNGEVERARAAIQQYGLEASVTLAGWIGPERKAELLATSDIYTLPSYNEGLPMSVLEAMAAGLPVVTSYAGGIPELVTDGEDGLLVEAGDRTGLTNALLRLLDDVDLRKTIGDAARQRVESRYSDTVILPQLREIYRSCAKA